MSKCNIIEHTDGKHSKGCQQCAHGVFLLEKLREGQKWRVKTVKPLQRITKQKSEQKKNEKGGGGGQLPRSISGLQSPEALDSSTPSRTNFTALVLACFLSRSAMAGSLTSK